jgi:CO dehydrogenase/acetyl-CoA synthase epsilon subunit
MHKQLVRVVRKKRENIEQLSDEKQVRCMNSNSNSDEVVLIAFQPDAEDRIFSIIKQLQSEKTNKQPAIAREEKKV